MGLPKRRHSPSRRDKRRTHDRLSQPSVSLCPQCHEPLQPHNICRHCGYYKGREIIAVEEEK
ncbi:MAG: 50S ribosomal protein L32 [Thermodesulfobacteriota bacterium]